MKIDNLTIAQLLIKVADELEINLDNLYRVKAFRRAARSIEKLDINLSDLVEKDEDITFIPYVGKGIAAYVADIVKNGKLSPVKYKKLKE